MRRLWATTAFVAGYIVIVALDPAVAAAPAFASFCFGGSLLVRQPQARELGVRS